jgi:hypothetical protein
MFSSAPVDFQILTDNKIIQRVNYITEFEVLMAMTMGDTVFWGVTSCSPIEGHHCFGRMTKLYWNTWHQILKDSTLYIY